MNDVININPCFQIVYTRAMGKNKNKNKNRSTVIADPETIEFCKILDELLECK